jgi:hypothetical protein
MSRRIVSLIAIMAFSATPILAQTACPDGTPRDIQKI